MNNYFNIKSSDWLNDQHTHIVLEHTNSYLQIPNLAAEISAKKIIAHYNATTNYPHVKSLSNIKLLPNPNRATHWESLTYALKKSCNDGTLFEHVVCAAYMVGCASLFIRISKALSFFIRDMHNQIGKGVPLYDVRNGAWIKTNLPHTTYTEPMFITHTLCLMYVTALSVLLITLSIFLVIKNTPTYSDYQKYKNEKNSTFILTQEIITDRLSMENIDVNDINNVIGEDRNPEDPISLNPISKEQLRTPSTFLIGKYVITHNSALEAILRKKISGRGSLQIPHPVEDRVMDDSERSIFLDNLSKLMCETREKIINCWEVVNNTLEQELTPSKRFSQLATTSVVFKLTGDCALIRRQSEGIFAANQRY